MKKEEELKLKEENLKEEIKKFIKESYPNGLNSDCFEEEVDMKNEIIIK